VNKITYVSVAAVENLLKAPRSAIIEHLKQRGSMSVEEMAEALGVSRVCVRKHLGLLERDGLIRYQQERHERGRPRFIYGLTEKADCLFPRAYDDLAREILEQLQKRFGEGAVESVFAARADSLIEQLKTECRGLTFEQSLRHLVKSINTKGYVADMRRQKDGSYRLTQKNCPTEAIAMSHPQLCEEELRIYREVLDCEVIRECRISNGAQTCGYRIVPRVKLSLRVIQPRSNQSVPER
jgi:predicted ArsR family transcriptional regulator